MNFRRNKEIEYIFSNIVNTTKTPYKIIQTKKPARVIALTQFRLYETSYSLYTFFSVESIRIFIILNE